MASAVSGAKEITEAYMTDTDSVMISTFIIKGKQLVPLRYFSVENSVA